MSIITDAQAFCTMEITAAIITLPAAFIDRRPFVNIEQLKIFRAFPADEYPADYRRRTPALPNNESRPWRTGLLARELIARGHDVCWWTSTVNHFTKTLFRESSQAVS